MLPGPAPLVEPLRVRRREQTVREIKQAALTQLAEGQDELSLRGVAREVGVSVQALYHYFDSRDALVTALVADAFHGLADAVCAAGADSALSWRERSVAAGLAYRRWALDNRAAFLLALGAPLPGYSAPEGGSTDEAAHRMGTAFREVLFGGWTDAELAAVPMPEGSKARTCEVLEGGQSEYELPPGALALFLTGWSTLHGFVMLEAHGHLRSATDAGAELCRAALLCYLDALERGRG